MRGSLLLTVLKVFASNPSLLSDSLLLQPPPVTGSKVALRALTRVMVSQAAPASPVATERTQAAYQALCANAS